MLANIMIKLTFGANYERHNEYRVYNENYEKNKMIYRCYLHVEQNIEITVELIKISNTE